MSQVVVYTRTGCMQCRMTERYLKEHNVPFEEHNINEEPQYVDHLKALGFRSLPVVMPKDAEPIVGFRPDSLKALVG